MKILYSLSHPGDSLNAQRAGHIVRANAILSGLASLGHEIVRVEAAKRKGTQVAVNTYRNIFKTYLPRPFALKLRDAGRILHGRRHARLLIEAVDVHKPDCILETFLAFNLAGKIASESTGLPLVIDDVAPIWEEEQQYGVGLKGAAWHVYRQATDQASLLVAVNGTIRQHLLDQGLPNKKIVTVENGIDEGLFNQDVDGGGCRLRYGIGSDEVVVVFVGSFQPYHRVDLLIQAFARVVTQKTVRLLLVGEGKYSDEARSVAADLGLGDKVVFTGRIPYEEVSSYMAAGDIAVMPATNEYGNPMKVYEYMALGKAVVAPNQETITEIAEHNQTAYLFERESIEGLSRALQDLIEDSSLRKRLGEQAGKLAARHTWHTRAVTMQQAIQSALSSRGRKQ